MKRVRVVVITESPWLSEEVVKYDELSEADVEQLKNLLKQVRFKKEEGR